MQKQQATSFADDLVAIRGRSIADDSDPPVSAPDTAEDFSSDLAALRAEQSPADTRSRFARVVDTLFSAPEFVRSAGRRMEDDALRLGVQGHPLAKPAAMIAGFTAGTTEALATPGDLLLTATGLKSVRDAGRGIGAAARAIEGVGSGALALRGAERMADAESVGEGSVGVVQTALGAAGVHSARAPRSTLPQPQRTPVRQLRAAPIVVTPDGAAVPPGRTPVSAPAGPSFSDVSEHLRATREAKHPPLPMRRDSGGTYVPEDAPMTRPAAVAGRGRDGQVVYSGDAEAVDVRPAPRAALPERASSLEEFVPTPGGRVARKRDVAGTSDLVSEAGRPSDDFASELMELRRVSATPVEVQAADASIPSVRLEGGGPLAPPVAPVRVLSQGRVPVSTRTVAAEAPQPVGSTPVSPLPTATPVSAPSTGRTPVHTQRDGLVGRYKPGNPFAEKAASARITQEQLSGPTARDAAMADAFPVGTGYGRKGGAARLDATIDRGVKAVSAGREADRLEAQAEAFDGGRINAQGRSVDAGTAARSEKRQQAAAAREERIAAARTSRGDKPAWAVPRAVYADGTGQLAGGGRKLVEEDHAEAVRKAVARGESVPEEVVLDYPAIATARLADPDASGVAEVRAGSGAIAAARRHAAEQARPFFISRTGNVDAIGFERPGGAHLRVDPDGRVYGGSGALLEDAPGGQAAMVDVIDTGEQQIRLPGAEAARQAGRSDTTFRAPQQASGGDFSLRAEETPLAATRREAAEQAARPALFDAPEAAAAQPPKTGPVDDADRRELRRMLAEMESMPFTKHTFNRAPVGRGGDVDIVPGAAGAPVFNDIMGGASGNRQAVISALRSVLDGKKPTAIGQRAIEVARRRQVADVHVARPQLPPDAGDLPQTGLMTDQDAGEFDALVSRLSGEPLDDLGHWGEAGGVQPALLGHMAGGATGAAAGVASSDEDDSLGRKVLRGVIGGALGAAAPGLLRGRAAADALGDVARPVGARHTPPVESQGSFTTTTRTPASPAHPRRDPMKGVDTFIEKFPEELRAGVRDVLERNQGFDAQRRGVLSEEDTARLAEGIRVDATRRLKPGTALNAEGIRRFTDGIATAQGKVVELSARVTGGQATDADLVALEAARSEVASLAASVMGARSEAGRALAEFKVLARVLETGNPELIRQAADGVRGGAADFARAFGEQPNDALTRYRWLESQRGASVAEKVRSYYYANILSGVKTHERNVIGNAANVLSNLAVQPFQAAADAARSALTGAPRTIYLSELASQAAGAVVGIPRGFSEALFSARNGVNRSALTQAMSAAEAGKLDVPRVEFKGGGSNPFNWPGRALDSADQFFRTVAKSMELSGLAHAQAKREGLTGRGLQDRMAVLMSGSDPLSHQLEEQADAFARRSVFQERPGRFTQSLQAFSKQHPAFSFVVPFIKTPANILRQGAEFSPAGAVMRAAREPGRSGSQAQGRAALGSLAGAYLAYLAATGRLSGSGPENASDRAQLMESGWRPNSVRIGDRWVSYQLFQPVNTQANVVANAFEAWRAAGADEDEVTKSYKTVMKSLKSTLDQSFLSGLADLVEAVENPTRGGASRYLAGVANGLLPFSGAQRAVKDALDPNVRAPEGFVESLAASVPGLSSSVPARLDRFGREVQREGGALQRATDPFNTSTVSDDHVLAELGRLGLRVGAPTGNLAKLDLSRMDARAVQQAKGQTTYLVIERLVSSDRYRRLSDEKKVEALEHGIDSARRGASDAMRTSLKRRGIGELPIRTLPAPIDGRTPVSAR